MQWKFILLIVVIFCWLSPACAPLNQVDSSPERIPRLFAIQPSSLALVGFDKSFNLISQQQLNIPPGCQVNNAYGQPTSAWVLVQLICGNWPVVQAVNVQTGQSQLLLDGYAPDSQFLSWDASLINQPAAFIKTDVFGEAKIIRVLLEDNKQEVLSYLPLNIYHMDSVADKNLFVLSNGLGLGSEIWQANDLMNSSQLIKKEPLIFAFARFSPDANQIAVIKMPDSTEAFPAGELWVMDSAGGNGVKLGAASAGRGAGLAWSHDSSKIAFGGEESFSIFDLIKEDLMNQSGALIGSPVWSPDGARVFATLGRGDTIELWMFEVQTGQFLVVPNGQGYCCAVWLGLAP